LVLSHAADLKEVLEPKMGTKKRKNLLQYRSQLCPSTKYY